MPPAFTDRRQDVEDVLQTGIALIVAMARKKTKRWGFDRKQIVPVRFSDEEKHQVKVKADAAGLALSTFIRAASLQATVTSSPGVSSTQTRSLRHRLRQVHTSVQQALLHPVPEAGADHLHRALTLLGDTIADLGQDGREAS